MATAGAGAGAAASTRFAPSQEPIVLPAAQDHRSTVIMLHGLGDAGYGWLGLAQQLAAELPNTEWVLPSAPMRPISRFGGQCSTAWFDIPAMSLAEQQQDREGMHASADYVETLLQEQAKAGIPSERVVIGGFSQGAAIALLTLRRQQRLAGVMALSGFCPLPDEQLLSDGNAHTPVFMAHGDADPMITYDRAERSRERLLAAGAKLDFRTYRGMVHTVRDDEMSDIRRFLAERLG